MNKKLKFLLVTIYVILLGLCLFNVVVYSTHEDQIVSSDEPILSNNTSTISNIDEVLSSSSISIYDDVKPNVWYSKSGSWVTEKGIMVGTDDLFHPDENITRAMFASVVNRISGNLKTENRVLLRDIDPEKYYYDDVRWAYTHAIIEGISDTEFAPNAEMTREQIICILYRLARYWDYTNIMVENDENIENYFYDFKDVSDYAQEPVIWAIKSGLITGTDKHIINPKKLVTRAEVAQLVKNFCEKYEKP